MLENGIGLLAMIVW